MDGSTQEAITNALDKAIVATAEKEFRRLSEGLTPKQIVKELLGSLRSLEGLQQGTMPDYDEWDSLLYILWYQPEHINLAYTLALRILKQDADSIQKAEGLEVYDFGCGAMAMQFGLALAAAETWPRGISLPRISIISEDTSDAMKSIGNKLWRAFNSRINATWGHPELNGLRKVCNDIGRGAQRDSLVVRWLTVLHVAYEEIHYQIKQELNGIVKKHKPEKILVTAHPGAFLWAFVPIGTKYYRSTDNFSEDGLAFKGEFQKTSEFRKQLFVDHIEKIPNALSDDDMAFVRNYLTNLPTSWVTSSSFESRLATFRRK